MGQFPIDEVRRQFPAIRQARETIFFDNAAGAQIPDRVLTAVTEHLVSRNVQRGGPYRESREVDAMIGRARASVAAFVHARGADEIAFGLNATSFIRSISLAIGQTLGDRPEIVVSDADHEANVATWLALERAGARIIWWRAREDGRLDPADLAPLVSERTRLVACTMASNVTGSRVDVTEVSRLAHRHGADVFIDAVHFAPHGAIDVQAIDCDYLVCSGYKIFAPHMGFAWCRREAMARLPTFREEFIPDVMPDKLEAGTYVYENVAGMDAAVAYLEEIGRHADPDVSSASRTAALHRGMTAIAEYERGLSAALIEAMRTVPGVTIHGIVARDRLMERVPTLCFTVEGRAAGEVADGLAARGVAARSGHMYSPRLVAKLAGAGGAVVRASLAHYNTVEEIARFRDVLAAVVVARA